MQQVIFKDLGLIDYKECWDYQEKLFDDIVRRKYENRGKPKEAQLQTDNYLLFCEHPHVYTLGKSGDIENLLINDKEPGSPQFYKINRGGDITYHGPGQLVGYPILDLDLFFTDIGRYLRSLEEAVIRTLANYDIEAGRYEGFTGVWLDTTIPAKARKICALGVRISRWVSMHGFAFNINTDLDYFKHIVPCGLQDKAVTSMERELGKIIDTEEVKTLLKKHLSDIFEMELTSESYSHDAKIN